MTEYIEGLDDGPDDGRPGRENDTLARQALLTAKRGTNGKWERAHCPFCEIVLGKKDKSRSWGHEIATSRWKCFRCKTWGYFKSGATQRDYRPPVATAAPTTGIGIDQLFVTVPTAPVELTEAQQLPESFEYLKAYRPTNDPWDERPDAIKYLRSRGVHRPQAVRMKLGLCMEGKFHHRIIVPMFDHTTGALVGFVGRSFLAKPFLKYLYPKLMPRGTTFFNHAALHTDTSDPVLVVEGVFDALPFYPHAVACLGKPSDTQVELLAKCKRPVVICLDGDAWREGVCVALQLELAGCFAVSVKLPPGEDPGSVTRPWLRAQALAAIAQKKAQ